MGVPRKVHDWCYIVEILYPCTERVHHAHADMVYAACGDGISTHEYTRQRNNTYI